MANKLYEEEYVREIAKAIRVKLATPNTEAIGDLDTETTKGKQYTITEMEEAINKIPVRLGFPSSRKDDINIDELKSLWEAPENGYVFYEADVRSVRDNNYREIVLTNDSKKFSVQDVQIGVKCAIWQHYDAGVKAETFSMGAAISGIRQKTYLCLPVSKGDKVKVEIKSWVTASTQSEKAYFVCECECEDRDALAP